MRKNRKNTGDCPQPITAGCLFAGMGGFCQGLKLAGIETLWANENDPHALETLKANYQQTRIVGKDVKDLSVRDDDLAQVDVMTAGFPCQSFSMAGKREGFDDQRGQLFFEIPRILSEFGPKRPPILILENVPYFMYGNDGEWLERAIREIQAVGYWFSRQNCQILNTAEITNLPHRRNRIFMAALSVDAFDCNDFSFPETNGTPLDIDLIIKRTRKAGDDAYLPEENRYHQIIARQAKKGDEKSIYQLRRSYARENKKECPPLTANMGAGGHNVPFIWDKWGLRRLTVEECCKMQGFNIDFPEGVPQNERYRQIGNAVSVPVAEKIGEECVHIIRRMRGKKHD